MRNLERELGKLLRKTATGLASGEINAPVTVDAGGVRKALGRQRFFQESVERTAVPGVATGLSVTGAGGDVLFIEATSMPGKEWLCADGPARRRDEGVGADRALICARSRRRARHRGGRVPGP